MPSETFDVWGEINRWAELLAPISNEPRPVRMEVGPEVVGVLKERFAPVLYPNARTEWRGHSQLFGVPIVPYYMLAPYFWRVLDQYRKVMTSGNLAAPQYDPNDDPNDERDAFRYSMYYYSTMIPEPPIFRITKL